MEVEPKDGKRIPQSDSGVSDRLEFDASVIHGEDVHRHFGSDRLLARQVHRGGEARHSGDLLITPRTTCITYISLVSVFLQDSDTDIAKLVVTRPDTATIDRCTLAHITLKRQPKEELHHLHAIAQPLLTSLAHRWVGWVE